MNFSSLQFQLICYIFSLYNLESCLGHEMEAVSSTQCRFDSNLKYCRPYDINIVNVTPSMYYFGSANDTSCKTFRVYDNEVIEANRSSIMRLYGVVEVKLNRKIKVIILDNDGK